MKIGKLSVLRNLVAAVTLCLSATSVAQPKGFNYDEAKVPEFELPVLLTTTDGTAVTSASQWTEVRRPEVLALFEEHVFGTAPPPLPRLRTRVRSRVNDALNGLAVRREITVYFSDDDSGPQMDMLVYTPAAATGPVPCFLGLNFKGNHTIEADPAIHLPMIASAPGKGPALAPAKESERGTRASRWPAAMIVEAGFGLATIYYGDIDPDFHDDFHNGIHSLWPDLQGANRPANAGGSIAAWTWGLSRAMDVLEGDALVDGHRVAVFGHSRLGKTSLWAGATDPRFRLVISNNSGCGGAALSRRRFGETVARINTVFPHWFCRNHRQYNDNETAMPVDHHMLIALSAPRAVYVASAEKDQWADPRGEMLSLFHAGPVFKLFDRQGLPTDDMPQIDQPIETDVGYHIRTGRHDVTRFDWQQYLNFARKTLR